MISTCPNCRTGHVTPFFETRAAPIHSVLLLKNRDEAVRFPRGEMCLGVCDDCAFIFNMAFDEDGMTYELGYESTQAYSGTFRAFQEAVVDRLMDTYDLAGKHAIEVGCAQGEFLELMRQKGIGSATGFDPAHDASRSALAAQPGFEIIADYFNAQQAERRSDVLACLMTIEHVIRPADFLQEIVDAIDTASEPVVYLQAPNAEKILDDGAFWDVYYEHCSYFTAPSLRHVVEHAGLDVLNTRTEYDDQYLTVDARPSKRTAQATAKAADIAAIRRKVTNFAANAQATIAGWTDFLNTARARGETVVLWGGGSKAVAFLTALDEPKSLAFAVDINPLKNATFLPGSGVEVISPNRLEGIGVDHVIVLNPIYMNEIAATLEGLGLRPKLHAITDMAGHAASLATT